MREADLASLRCHVSREEDVLLLLGQPDLCGENERFLVYGWSTSNLGLLFLAGGQFNAVGGAIDLNLRNRYIQFEFDDEHVLRSVHKIGFGRDSHAEVGELKVTRVAW